MGAWTGLVGGVELPTVSNRFCANLTSVETSEGLNLRSPNSFVTNWVSENTSQHLTINILLLPISSVASKTSCKNDIASCSHRRSQDFVWGVHFFLPKKVDDLFLVVALKNSLNIPPNITCTAKTVLKLTLALAGGWRCTSCPGGALTHFFCKIRLKKFFFTALGCRCTHCTPWLRLWLQ